MDEHMDSMLETYIPKIIRWKPSIFVTDNIGPMSCY